MTTKEINTPSADECARLVHETTESLADRQRRVSREQRRNGAGKWAVSAQVEAERSEELQRLRDEIDASTGLPATFIEELRAELAMLLAAIRESTQELAGAGIFTSKGTLRLAFRTRLALAQRAATVAQQLGLEAPAAGKQKPWAKMSRAEQEAAAQAALDAVHGVAGGYVEPSGARGED